MGYELNKHIGYSISILKKKEDNDIWNKNFFYLSHTNQGSSGSPIMNLNNFKLLRMHVGRIIDK